MKKKYLLLLLSLLVGGLFASTKKDFIENFDKASSQYKAGNYYEALPLFLELYNLDTTNSNINYLVGACYMKARSRKARAIIHLEKDSPEGRQLNRRVELKIIEIK